LPFFGHQKWRELEYPPRVDQGAGAARAIGAALAAPELPRIRQRIREVLVHVLQDPPPSATVPVQMIAGGGGGTGGALLSTCAYWLLVEGRRVAPAITLKIEVMLILDPYYHAVGFQGTQRETRRLPANVAQALKELLWLQTPKNGVALQNALGIANPLETPPVAVLLPFGSDATGATPTPVRLFPRMIAVVIARNHPGIAALDRILLSNASAQLYGEFGPSERAIVTADAAAVAWLPPAVAECYALTREEEVLKSALALAEAERIEGLKDSFKPRLGLDGITGDIDKTLDELVPAEKTSVDPAVAKKSDREVRDELLKVHKYHNAHCLPVLLARAKAKAEENERQVIPGAVQATVDAILAQAPSLPTARSVAEALAADLDEDAANVRALLDAIKRANFLGAFAAKLAELKKNSLRIRDRIARGIDDRLGALRAPLAPERLMTSEPGALLDEFSRATGNRYATFARHELNCVSGAVAYGRLRFALGNWAAAAAARITPPVALDFLPIGGEANAPCHRYFAAPAQEHAVLIQARNSSPALRSFQIEDNDGDPFTVVIRHRYAGLPVSTLSAAPEYDVAIAEVERLDQSKVVNVPWSCPEVEDAASIRLAQTFEPRPSISVARIVSGSSLAANDGDLSEPRRVEA
jgi:hypothetical protein